MNEDWAPGEPSPGNKNTTEKLTIGFQRHELPHFPTPVELLLAFQGSLDAPVNEGFVDDLPELGTKLASSEHFQSVSVHGFKMMNDPIGRFKNVFWCSLSYLHSFPHIAQIQSLRKKLLSHCALQKPEEERKTIPLGSLCTPRYLPAGNPGV